ncbi:AGE family epimerase/isomerase [Paenibacillus antarcticus]|uniref:Cellobiose 2-epimerase n=1 Tax=Paenibacillus antarcticus TaxID=253703 RepID=A0A168PVY3_9BACL|nr:AGE family epimerase/isomerase [Paenibacillus antarcticus]OAB47124.1 N-acylglucosamine 2-epimerase [Paenibacillus antarcticus]
MQKLKAEIIRELEDHILPFWSGCMDSTNGGFYGGVNIDLQQQPQADKGGIATSRILWSFSSAYVITGNEQYLSCAKHAYTFLIDQIMDKEFQGLYWMVDYMGAPKDTRKHVYTQSFGIYALSEYYKASKDPNALEMAKQLFHLIEMKGFNPEINAYKEEFDRVWTEIPNEMLSENGVQADITMNTHIHVLEAYTNLFTVWPDDRLRAALTNLLEILYTKIYNPNTKFLGVFFDKKWHSLLDLKSFGHDIEASWLIDRTLHVLNIDKPEYVQMVIDIAYNIANYAIQEDGSLINEQEQDHVDKTRVWWVQAEAIVGFYNAYQRTQDPIFLKLVSNLWHYIKDNIIDDRPNGEWFWSIEPDGTPSPREINGAWKCPYHNSRFCLEMIERVN